MIKVLFIPSNSGIIEYTKDINMPEEILAANAAERQEKVKAITQK